VFLGDLGPDVLQDLARVDRGLPPLDTEFPLEVLSSLSPAFSPLLVGSQFLLELGGVVDQSRVHLLGAFETRVVGRNEVGLLALLAVSVMSLVPRLFFLGFQVRELVVAEDRLVLVRQGQGHLIDFSLVELLFRQILALPQG